MCRSCKQVSYLGPPVRLNVYLSSLLFIFLPQCLPLSVYGTLIQDMRLFLMHVPQSPVVKQVQLVHSHLHVLLDNLENKVYQLINSDFISYEHFDLIHSNFQGLAPIPTMGAHFILLFMWVIILDTHCFIFKHPKVNIGRKT